VAEFVSEIRPDGVAVVTFDLPERLNPLGPDGLRALAGHLEALAGDPSVAAVVLTGRGKAYSSGASLDRLLDLMGSDGSPGLPDHLIRDLFDAAVNPIQRAIAAMPKPVVTAVNGIAAGGGVGLALAGDVVLAAAGRQLPPDLRAQPRHRARPRRELVLRAAGRARPSAGRDDDRRGDQRPPRRSTGGWCGASNRRRLSWRPP
jgi:hypothetical protein